MRTPKTLSYSAYALFCKDAEEYFRRYLAEHRPPRTLQERPAAAGAAFDAYVKSALNYVLFGHAASAQFDFDTIFTEQVEEHNRDWALPAGRNLFDSYVTSGAYNDLVGLLQNAVEPPRFEFTLEGSINGVPFLGKPDLRFIWDGGEGPVHIVHDWKVNGYCSKTATSPSKHYLLCRDGWGADAGKPTRGAGAPHPDFLRYTLRGLPLDHGWMENSNSEWADQLSLYAWLLGETPGDEDVVLSVDQLLGKPAAGTTLVRVAQFRSRVSRDSQVKLLENLTKTWAAISSGHVFATQVREENDAKCQELENQCISLASDGSVNEDFFSQCVRPAYRG